MSGQGRRHANRLLTEREEAELRRARAGGATYAELAEAFDCALSTAWRAANPAGSPRALARLAAANHHPNHPPPAFMDEMELRDMEHTRGEAEGLLEDGHLGPEPAAAVVELILRDVPALVAEVRHLNLLLGRDR